MTRRSYSMCKPNKMGWDPRWTAKQMDKIKRMEKEARRVTSC